MNSLYGDLPPPKSENSKRKNEKTKKKGITNPTKRANPYSSVSRYVDMKKTIIMPTAVQKKITIKKTDKTCAKNTGEECTKSTEIETQPSTINKIQHSDFQQENIFTSENCEPVKNGTTDKLQNNSTTPANSSLNTVNRNLLDINSFVQNDLKKISEQLSKIQKSQKPKSTFQKTNGTSPISLQDHIIDDEPKRTATNKIENQHTHEKKNENEYKYTYKQMQTHKQLQGYGHGINYTHGHIHRQEVADGKKKKIETNVVTDEKIKMNNTLYKKYFILDADEDYDPSNPNDLSKIIKERKRRLHDKLNAEIEKNNMFQVCMDIENMDDANKQMNLMDPCAKYVNYKEKEYPEKKENGAFGKYEEQFKRNTSYVKEMFAKGSTTHTHEHHVKWNLRKNNEQEKQSGPGTSPEKCHSLYTQINEKEMKKSKWSVEEGTQNESEYYLPHMQEPSVASSKADSEVSTVNTKKDFATRMMEKMGWKKGEGLGKSSQGITTPLILQKVNKRGGVIVQTAGVFGEVEDDIPKEKINKTDYSTTGNNNESEGENPQKKYNGEKTTLNHDKQKHKTTTSRYVFLSNAIRSTEMNTSLKEEIETEAAQFGNLLNIHFISDKSTPEDSSLINIICEYESTDQANSAVKKFNKIILKGRQVKASFITDAEFLLYISNEKFHNINEKPKI